MLKLKGILVILNGLCGFYWYRFVDKQLISITMLFSFSHVKSEQNI